MQNMVVVWRGRSVNTFWQSCWDVVVSAFAKRLGTKRCWLIWDWLDIMRSGKSCTTSNNKWEEEAGWGESKSGGLYVMHCPAMVQKLVAEAHQSHHDTIFHNATLAWEAVPRMQWKPVAATWAAHHSVSNSFVCLFLCSFTRFQSFLSFFSFEDQT